MENTYPAGVINVGFESEISAVFTPAKRVVLPAKLFTITVKTKTTMLDHLSRTELLVTNNLSPNPLS
jgi:hypothetical protein